MSNPTVSFRISDYHLARGLRAVRQLEPHWKMTTTADLIRTIFNDYIAKSEHFNNHPLQVPTELLHEIAQARLGIKEQNQAPLPRLGPVKQKTPQQLQRELEEEELFNQMRKESLEKLAAEKELEKLATQPSSTATTEEQPLETATNLPEQKSPQEIEQARIFMELRQESTKPAVSKPPVIKSTGNALFEDLPTDSVKTTVSNFDFLKEFDPEEFDNQQD